VIATGDTLDGAIVQNLTFCEEGLSDSGELAFIAQLEDASSPDGFRMAVFRAAPSLRLGTVPGSRSWSACARRATQS
jgi:hypothetical protein